MTRASDTDSQRGSDQCLAIPPAGKQGFDGEISFAHLCGEFQRVGNEWWVQHLIVWIAFASNASIVLFVALR